MAVQRQQCEAARRKPKSCKAMLPKLRSRSHWSEFNVSFRYLLLVPRWWLVNTFSAAWFKISIFFYIKYSEYSR